MARKARKSPPIPEVIRGAASGRKWTVTEPGGDTPVFSDRLTGKMVVPLDDSDASAFVRTHEMARLTWSPDAPITDPYEQAFEEARLNLLTKQVGLPTDTYREPGTVETTIANNMANKATAALTRVALTGTSDEAVASRTLAGVDPQVGLWANEALTHLRKSKLTFKGVQEAAEYLRRRVTMAKSPQPRPEPGDGPARPGKPSDGPPSSGPAPKLVLPPMPEAPKVAPAKPKPKPGKSKADDSLPDAVLDVPVLVSEYVPTEGKLSPVLVPPRIGTGSKEGQWATMTVVSPPMPLRLPRRVGKGKWRPADCGAVPRRMERWCSDQAVFSTKGRQRSGTVLIDGSSSISIPVEQIKMILTQAPAATVAMYSGSGVSGTLWVLARRGRRVATIPRRPGGNCVDGPALRWLAKQKAPRIWVCDEGVTGVYDHQAPGMVTEARNICRVFGIKRVDDVLSAIVLMGGKAKQRTTKM